MPSKKTKWTKVTVENSIQRVAIENLEQDYEISATDIAEMFYRAMLALEYHPKTARDMFSDKVDI